MALRPFTFGVRLRDGNRTVKVRANARDPKRYVVEDSHRGSKTRHKDHSTLGSALRDAASTWRSRLN